MQDARFHNLTPPSTQSSGGRIRFFNFACLLILSAVSIASAQQEDTQARSDDQQYVISQALSLHRRGQSEAAIATVQSFLQKHPGNNAVRLELARYLGYAKKFPEALEQYKMVVRSDPNSFVAQVGVAKVLSWEGDLNASLVAYNKILERSPRLYDARVGKGFTLLWMGEKREALAILQDAAQSHPEDKEVAATVADLRSELHVAEPTPPAITSPEPATKEIAPEIAPAPSVPTAIQEPAPELATKENQPTEPAAVPTPPVFEKRDMKKREPSETRTPHDRKVLISSNPPTNAVSGFPEPIAPAIALREERQNTWMLIVVALLSLAACGTAIYPYIERHRKIVPAKRVPKEPPPVFAPPPHMQEAEEWVPISYVNFNVAGNNDADSEDDSATPDHSPMPEISHVSLAVDQELEEMSLEQGDAEQGSRIEEQALRGEEQDLKIEEQEAQPEDHEPGTTALRGRCLLVDENEQLLGFERMVLSSSGLDVSMAHSLTSALGILEHESIDIVIINSQLQGGNTWREIQRRAADQHFAVKILLTYSGGYADAQKLEFHSGLKCLCKPIKMAELLAAVQTVLQHPEPRPRPPLTSPTQTAKIQ